MSDEQPRVSPAVSDEMVQAYADGYYASPNPAARVAAGLAAVRPLIEAEVRADERRRMAAIIDGARDAYVWNIRSAAGLGAAVPLPEPVAHYADGLRRAAELARGEFIVRARGDGPDLLAEFARLQEDNQRLHLLLEQAEDYAREQGDTAAEAERELDSCQEISDRHYSDAERLTGVIERIRALHRRCDHAQAGQTWETCVHCSKPWPCPTAALLPPTDHTPETTT